MEWALRHFKANILPSLLIFFERRVEDQSEDEIPTLQKALFEKPIS